MSNTVRKAKDIYRFPKLRGSIKEAHKAQQELKLLGYKPRNRTKARSNISYPRAGRTSSGWKEQYVPDDIILKETLLIK
jgi:hypothetical protein